MSPEIIAQKCKDKGYIIAFTTIRSALKFGNNTKIHTITLDNGSEFADFLNIEKDSEATIYFADPHSPWQRGLNANTNDMLRFFYTKGTDFLKAEGKESISAAESINTRPGKCLNCLSPMEFFQKSVAVDLTICPAGTAEIYKYSF